MTGTATRADPEDEQPLRLAPAVDDPRRPGRTVRAVQLRPGDRLISGRVVLSVGTVDADDGEPLVAIIALGAGAKWRHTWRRSTPVRILTTSEADDR